MVPVALGVTPVMAQEVAPAPETPLSQWIFVMVSVVLVALVVAVSFVSSKRGHRD